MVAPRHRTNTLKKVFRRTPGGKVVTHYKRKIPSKAHCAACGAVLNAVPTKRAYKMENMAKSKKRPERPFGGLLCTKCTSRLIIQESRESEE